MDEAVAKATTEEYSPMPSEEPSESPFEARRPSVAPRPTDSDVEVPKPAKAKRSKKKKGRKSDAGPVRPSHDDDAQGE